jgi:hypothetical protein
MRYHGIVLWDRLGTPWRSVDLGPKFRSLGLYDDELGMDAVPHDGTAQFHVAAAQSPAPWSLPGLDTAPSRARWPLKARAASRGFDLIDGPTRRLLLRS